MIIDEINETNFEEKLTEGEKELQIKFDSWDRLGKNKDRMNKAEFKARVAYLWRDPTIWAYAVLRDKQDNPLRVHPFQDIIMNDKGRFVHVHAANQIGKTWSLAIIKGLHHLFHVNNASVMIISSKEDQAIGILDEMKWMLKRAKVNYEGFKGDVDNRTEMQVIISKTNVAVARTFPPTTAILSFPATLTIMDENNFWEKIGELVPIEYYDQCIEPRSNATKNWKHPFLTMGQIVGISNPNGQQGLGWRCLNDERFNNYIYNWLANPNNSLEEYLYHKKRLPSYRFASIYAATYEDVQGGFITTDQYNQFASFNHKLIIDRTKSVFLGGDVASTEAKGKNTDWNVLYGVQAIDRYEKDAEERLPRLKLVYMKEWPPGTQTTELYKEIKRLLDSGISIPKFAYDKVGVGDKISNDLIDRGILSRHNIEVLTYSLPNKSDVFINFQTLFEQGLIEGCDIPKLKEQLFGLKVEQPLGSVHLKIHHKTEGIKDDHCFIAGTKVLTNKGQVPIEKLKVGDKVMTRQGYKKIIGIGNRLEKVITKFGITATPNHPFITKDGIKRFKYVNALDTLYIWNEKQLSIKEGNITDILNQEVGICEYIFGHILKANMHLLHYIDRFGKIISERFQKAIKSTTKMEIPLITLLTILNVFLLKNIQQNIGLKRKQKNQERILLNSQDLKLLNGIVLKKEENGIKNNILKLFQKLKNINIHVSTAIKNIGLQGKRRQTIAANTVDTSIGMERVFNIHVKTTNEFFANNILVHNCDALANACYAAKRLLSITPSFTPLKTEPKPFEKTSDKRYTLICSECEKVNYNENNGYYEGYNPKGENFTKIPCPIHKNLA